MFKIRKNRVPGVDIEQLIQQIFASILGRKSRAVLTIAGIAIGTAIFVMTYGWTLAAGATINTQFDKTVTTSINVTLRNGSSSHLGSDFTGKVTQLDGVVAGGRIVPATDMHCEAHPGMAREVSVNYVDAGYLRAVGAKIGQGRLYEQSIRQTSPPAAVLGPSVAKDLGISHLLPGQTIRCDGVTVAVYGILREGGDSAQTAASVLLSKQLDGRAMPSGVDSQVSAVVRTELGATKSVARVLSAQLSPTHPQDVAVTVPPSPEELRRGVSNSLNILAIGVSALSLLVGGIGIMTTMFTSVMERTREIGLRRALGARPAHIAAQFIAEGALYGGIGSTVGLSVGLVCLLVVVKVNGWVPVMVTWVGLVCVPVGTVIGMCAAFLPGRRAAKIPPAAALRAL
ncbi:MAG: ABC transporter permease [Actinomycetaceae bacterium]|nr:ABC transporter permease [Actinomycetaceae bacterium]